MMGKTNLKKYEEIEEMMNQFYELESDYLNKLKERYDYMSEYRAEYNKLKRAVFSVKSDLEGKTTSNYSAEEINARLESVKATLNKKLQRYLEAEEYETSHKAKQVISTLNESYNSLKKKVTKKRLENVYSDLIGSGIYVEELETLVNLYSRDKTEKKKLENVINLLDMAYSEYLSTFKEYRIACENKDDMIGTFSDIHKVLVGLDFDAEAAKLKATLPDYDDQTRQRPDEQELLELLVPFKSNELVYWQSNNNKSNAYYYNAKLAKSISKTRATLLRKAEFKGTENAFKELKEDYEALKSYMEAKYYQLGGKPHNFHGHENRKKKQ